MTAETQSLPVLPCPHCNANILEKGFHNTCIETRSVRENNCAKISEHRLRVWHTEDDHVLTIHHQCGVHAYCTNCGKPLPWPLFDLRSLDATPLGLSAKRIAKLLEKEEKTTLDPSGAPGKEN
jgi:hypothetical protein